MNRRLQVTVIDGDVSYPAWSGKRLRTLNLLLGLADDFKITYIARSDTAANTDAETYFRDHKINPIIVHAPLPPKNGPSFYARLATNLMEHKPYSVATHSLQPMRNAVQQHAATNHTDLWQLEWSGYEYCLDVSQGPVVLQAHNVDALIWQRYCDNEKNPIKRCYIELQRRKMQRFEEAVFQRMSRIVTVSVEDARLAQRLYGELPFDVVDNGVDISYFAETGRDPASRTVLFLGALDWRPNLDAIETLLTEIWPQVHLTLPDARLQIVGRHAPTGLHDRIALMTGCELISDVPDVRPYMRAAAVLAVPLRIGGGSRLKILEALAANLPVVSSTIGAEGIEIEDGRHYTRSDQPTAFASALIDALQNPDRHRLLAEAGRLHVTKYHDWPDLALRLGKIWTDATTGVHLSTPRAPISETPELTASSADTN